MPRWVKVTTAAALLAAIGCSSTTPPAKTTPPAPDTNKAGRSGDASPTPKPPPP